MARYRRFKWAGGSYFFTVALADRSAATLTDEIALLRRAVAETRAERPFAVDAMVILPDHLHAVWTLPPGDADFSTRWGAIKARFTRSVRAGTVGWNPTLPAGGTDARCGRVGFYPTRSPSKVRKGDAGLWQRRFWEHHIRDEADYAAHVRYCWGNPVKHGLVARAADWPYSSIHRDIRAGRVEAEWAGATIHGAFGE